MHSQLQIDLLLLLSRDDQRWWNARQFSAELTVPEPMVGSALEGLAACNLLDVRIGATLAYRLAPVDDESRAALGEALARLYDTREAVLRMSREPAF